MGCPKNPKKFLGLIPYKGDHVYKYVVAYWEFEEFQIIGTCEACGSSFHNFGLSFDQLLDWGFDCEFLLHKRNWDHHYESESNWRTLRDLKAKEDQ